MLKAPSFTKTLSLLNNLLLLLLPLAYLPFVSNAFELPKLVLFRVAVLLMIFFFVLRVVKDRQFQIYSIFQNSLLRKVLLGIILVLVLSTIFSIAPKLSFWGSYYRLQGFNTLLYCMLFFLLSVSCFHDFKYFDRAKKFLFFGTFLAAIFAILQYFGLFLNQYDIQEISLGRIFGTFGHPNYLAYYIVLIFAPLIAHTAGAKKKFIYVMGAILLLIALFLTESRAAILGLFVSLIIFGFLYGIYLKKRAWLILSLLFPALFGLLVVLANFGGSASSLPLLDRFVVSQENVRSLATRFNLWPQTLRMISKKPVFGYGPETFPIAFQKYADPEILKYEKLNSIPDKAHNTLLETASNYGLAGLAVYLFAIVAILKLSLVRLKKIQKKYKPEIIGVLAALMGLFAANTFGFSAIPHYIITTFWLAYLAFLLSDKSIKKPATIFRSKFISFVTITFVGIFVLSSLFFQNFLELFADYKFSKFTVQDVAQASMFYPNQRDYNYILSIMLLDAGDTENALYYAEKGGEFVSKKEAFYYFLLGNIYSKNCTQNCTKASSSYEKAYTLAPTYPPILLNWGHLYLAEDNCEKALEKFEKYLSIVPDDWKDKNSEKARLFYKHNSDFDQVFKYIDSCKQN